MKHYRTALSLAFCALLLLLPVRAYAAGYTELAAELPFTFRNDSSVPHTCTAVMEPVDGAPAPEQSEAQAESGGEGLFVIRFSRPGTFRYRVYQTNKDVSGVVYDGRVYTVTVAVRNAPGKGGLACSVWATVNGEEKLDAVAFVNRGQAEEPEPSPEEDEPSPRTGDGSRPALYFTVMVLAALALVCVMEKKYGRKAGDGV